MNLSEPFVRRPVATALLAVAILLAGMLAFRFLPVAPLPQFDFPTISISASLPGASPETMASAVATPLPQTDVIFVSAVSSLICCTCRGRELTGCD